MAFQSIYESRYLKSLLNKLLNAFSWTTSTIQRDRERSPCCIKTEWRRAQDLGYSENTTAVYMIDCLID